jgi:ABC-type phosphate transport system permease subunit
VKPTVYPEKETTQKKGIEQAAEYSLLVFILILIIIFVIILVTLFRKGKPPIKVENNKMA